jgi:hypothetical protein
MHISPAAHQRKNPVQLLNNTQVSLVKTQLVVFKSIGNPLTISVAIERRVI